MEAVGPAHERGERDLQSRTSTRAGAESSRKTPKGVRESIKRQVDRVINAIDSRTSRSDLPSSRRAASSRGGGIDRSLGSNNDGTARIVPQAVEIARRQAEAELAEELSAMGGRAKRKLPAATVGAANPKTGKAAADGSHRGCCADLGAADKVGGDPKDVGFTKPIRPKSGEQVPVGKNCQKEFDRSQFPPGTIFEE